MQGTTQILLGTPQYNSSTLISGGLWGGQTGSTTTLGAYTAYGYAAGYNGSGYTWSQPPRSPAQNIPG